MAASRALSYLVATITQSGADAFTQTAITTGLATDTRTAFRVREILLEFGAAGGAATTLAVSGAGYDVALTRKTESASPNITDRSLIWKYKSYTWFTTSGVINIPQVYRIAYDDTESPVLIVEPTIYCQFDTNGSSATNVGYIRIGYETQTISDVDRLSLVAASLAT